MTDWTAGVERFLREEAELAKRNRPEPMGAIFRWRGRFYVGQIQPMSPVDPELVLVSKTTAAVCDEFIAARTGTWCGAASGGGAAGRSGRSGRGWSTCSRPIDSRTSRCYTLTMMPPTKRWLWQSARDTVMLGAMYAVKFSGACVGVVFLSCTTVRLVLALWRGDIR